MNECNYFIKLIIIGDTGSGKSSIVHQYCEKSYDNNLGCTLGVNFNSKIITHDNKKIRIYIWDTTGNDRYKNIISVYYKESNGIILVFDLSDLGSLHRLEQKIDHIKTTMIKEYQIILVGNKCDNFFQINKIDIDSFIKKHNLQYIECSAKNDININLLFDRIINMVIDNNNYHQINLAPCPVRKESSRRLDCFPTCCFADKVVPASPRVQSPLGEQTMGNRLRRRTSCKKHTIDIVFNSDCCNECTLL